MYEFVIDFEFVFDTVVINGSVELFLGDLDENLLFSGDSLLLLDGEGLFGGFLVGLLPGLLLGLLLGLSVGLRTGLLEAFLFDFELKLVRLEATG